MTWKEFKDEIEKQGITDDDEIGYIDTYPERGVMVSWQEFPTSKEFNVTDA